MLDIKRHTLLRIFISNGRDHFKRLYSLLGTVMIALLTAACPVYAGQLILQNAGDQSITCTVDGFTVQSGGTQDVTFTVPPNASIHVLPNIARADQQISWVNCGQLKARKLTVGTNSANQRLLFNSRQTRVLNVSLYPYLPALPPTNLEGLADYVIKTYQEDNPQVLLNLTMDGAGPIKIYSFDDLPDYLNDQGFDVMELDMMYLGFLVDKGLINRQERPSGSPLPVALAASSVDGVLYAIPSWLCMDFLYSTNPALQQVSSLTALQTFLKNSPSGQTPLVADYVGKWRLPSMYVNAYVQEYGINKIGDAFNMPPDAKVMSNLTALVGTCAANGKDFCVDETYHDAPGTVEQTFAHGSAYANVGFSEQSFYTTLAGSFAPLYVTPMTWGKRPQPLLYADSFVTNKASCPSNSQCGADAAKFINVMTSLPMKNYIVMSKDYPVRTPWRTLLVPYESFYEQREVIDNPLYSQYQTVFKNAVTFPNTWTAAQQTSMRTQICGVFQATFPKYACTPPAAAPKASGPIKLKRPSTPAQQPRRGSKVPIDRPASQAAPTPQQRVLHGRR
ncbi:MAG TPA: hypothetical protein VF800_24245 [Telluria sp.]|jgi:hypothetical protein